jgi:hypothetical protein
LDTLEERLVLNCHYGVEIVLTTMTAPIVHHECSLRASRRRWSWSASGQIGRTTHQQLS